MDEPVVLSEECSDKDNTPTLCIGPLKKDISYDVIRGPPVLVDVSLSQPLPASCQPCALHGDPNTAEREMAREVTASMEELDYKKGALHEVMIC